MNYKSVALMLVASVLCGCGPKASDKTASGPWFSTDQNGVTVVPGSSLSNRLKLEQVVSQTMDITIQTTASVDVKPGCAAEIGLPFGGRVIRSFVQLGTPVGRGQALFEVSSSDYMEAVKDYQESRSAADLAEANRRRKEALHDSGVLSDREWEEVCADARNAANACELSRRALSLFQVDPAAVKVGEPLRVVSPISGRVVRNNLVIGGYLAEDAEAPMTVADLSRVWVTAHVKPAQVRGLAIGQPVQVATDADETTSGRIVYIGELLDEKTRTLPVVIECDNGARTLRPGMFVTALLDRHAERVLAVPSTAVFQGEGCKFVYMQDSPNHYVKTPVKVESLDSGRQQVLSGLCGGETIIVEGGIYLSE